MAEGLDQRASRFLTRRYLLALGLVALLTIAAQAVIQVHLRRQRHDAAVINLAGRQRMLSQELAKAALAWQAADDAAVRAARLAEVTQALAAWGEAHDRLGGIASPARATAMPGVGVADSPSLAAAQADIAPWFARMHAAAAALPGEPAAVARLLADEPEYLRRQEAIVGLYQAAADDHVRATITLELALFAVLLAALVAEALLVFRPAMRWLRRAIDDQEKLRAHEAANRELTAAAAVAQQIGYDLHDGVGQTLTALSLQAKMIEGQLLRMAPGASPVALAAQLAELRAGITGAMGETRAAAHRLVPVDVHAVGLEQALGRLAQNVRAGGVACAATCPPGVVPATAGEDLYRIAQEAVANALRHGGAKAIAIAVQPLDGEVQLTIEDDGGGAPPVEPAAEGIGMRSMRHHASRLGGTLASAPRPQGGWRVACRFPLTSGPLAGAPAAAASASSREPAP